jgi:hypothetical protein
MAKKVHVVKAGTHADARARESRPRKAIRDGYAVSVLSTAARRGMSASSTM